MKFDENTCIDHNTSRNHDFSYPHRILVGIFKQNWDYLTKSGWLDRQMSINLGINIIMFTKCKVLTSINL